MIAGSRACSTFSPAHSAQHHQPDKPALCRGPARTGLMHPRTQQKGPISLSLLADSRIVRYRTCTKMSGQWPGFGNTGHVFVSPATRLLAAEKNPIVDPSALMSGSVLASFACAPALSTL